MTSEFTLDDAPILDAINTYDTSAAVKEQVAALVETWVGECLARDLRVRTVAVEVAFYFWCEAKTLVIGYIDRLAADAQGVYACEWKTTGGEKRYGAKVYGTEEQWLEELVAGHQLKTYATALKYGSLIEAGKLLSPTVVFDAESYKPRVFVRAVTKNTPSKIYPAADDGMFAFDEKVIRDTFNAYLNAAASIRAMRATNVAPWQLPGRHCEKHFGKDCVFVTTCRGHKTPGVGERGPAPKRVYDDEGKVDVVSLLAAQGKLDVADPELVVLSSSQLDTLHVCREKWRQERAGFGKDASEALEIGSLFHVCASVIYRQIQKWQGGV